MLNVSHCKTSRYVKHALKITKSLYSNYSKIGMMTLIITNKKYYSYASSSCFIFWNSSFVMVFSPEIKKTHAQGLKFEVDSRVIKVSGQSRDI